MGLSLNQLTTTSGKIKQKEEFDKKKTSENYTNIRLVQSRRTLWTGLL